MSYAPKWNGFHVDGLISFRNSSGTPNSDPFLVYHVLPNLPKIEESGMSITSNQAIVSLSTQDRNPKTTCETLFTTMLKSQAVAVGPRLAPREHKLVHPCRGARYSSGRTAQGFGGPVNMA